MGTAIISKLVSQTQRSMLVAWLVLAVSAALLSGCGVGALLVGGGVAAGVILSEDDGSSSPQPGASSPSLSLSDDYRQDLRARGDASVVPICFQAGGAPESEVLVEYSRQELDFAVWRECTEAPPLPEEARPGVRTFWWAAAADLGLDDRSSDRVRVRVRSRKQRDDILASPILAVGNSPAEVRFIPVSVQEAEGDITLSFDARDAEGDPILGVKLYYVEPGSTESGGVEVEMALERVSETEPALRSELPAPENGLIYSPQWKSRDAIGSRNVEDFRVRLRGRDPFGLAVESELTFNLHNNRPPEARLFPINDSDDKSFSVPISFRLLDPDQHAVDVVVQYAVEEAAGGNPTPAFPVLPADFLKADFRARTLLGSGEAAAADRKLYRIATPLDGTSPLGLKTTTDGVEHNFVWDTRGDLTMQAQTSVRVRVTPFDDDEGQESETVSAFVVDNDLFPAEIRLGEDQGLVSGAAIGDLNDDGRPDVALALFEARLRPDDPLCTEDLGRIDVYLRGGDGTFSEQPLHLRPGSAESLTPCTKRNRGPSDLIIADVDSDDFNDLAALTTNCPAASCSSVRGEVSIFYGPLALGEPLRSPDATLAAGADVRSMAIGDFDANKMLDIAVSNHNRLAGTPIVPRSVGIFRQLEARSFVEPMEYFSDCDDPQCEPGLLACADFDGDGRDEIAVRQDEPTKNRVLILGWSKTTPELVVERTVQLPRSDPELDQFSPISVAAADVNQDGRPDLFVGSRNVEAVYAFLNDRGEGFLAPQKLCLSAPPERIALADITGDGQPEIIAVEPGRLRGSIEIASLGSQACCPAPCAFKELLFALPEQGHAGPAVPALGDLNGDGSADLLFGSSDGARLFLSAGPGSLLSSRPRALEVGSSNDVLGLALGDLNADGLSDLAAAAASLNRDHYEVLLYFQRRRGGFPARPSLVLRSELGATCQFQSALYLELADVDEDGAVDLIALSRWGGVDVFWRGSAGFAPESSRRLEFCDQATATARRIAFGRFGGAGTVDLLSLDPRGDVITGQGRLMPWTLRLESNASGIVSVDVTEDSPAATDVQPQTMTKADFNADGLDDVALLYGRSSTISVLYQDPSLAWPDRLEPGSSVPAGARNGKLIAADFDGDGRSDMLLLPNVGEAAPGFTWSAGAGGQMSRLVESFRLELGGPPLSGAAADWSGDGLVDIVVGVADQSRLLLFPRREGGGYGPLSSWAVELESPLARETQIVAHDWSGDGSIDLVVSSPETHEILILEAR